MAALARASHSSIITQPRALLPPPSLLSLPVCTQAPKASGFASWMPVMGTQRECCVHACMWWHVCVCGYMVAHAHKRACLHMCALAHVGTCVRTCMHTHACWCMCVHECTCVHTCVCSPACTHVHAPWSVWSRKGFPSFQSHHSAVRIGEAQPTRSSRCCISLSSPRCHP